VTTATGEAIRQLREAAGLSREKLAQAAGISAAYINKVEHGTRRPTTDALRKVAEGLKMTVDELTARIAVVDYSAAPSVDEAQRRLLRTAAVGSGATLLAAAPLLPPSVTAAVIAAGVSVIRRRQERTAKSTDDLSIDELRDRLVSRLRQMTPDQLELVAPLIEQISNCDAVESGRHAVREPGSLSG
jgi:transcriptional regulator with XRE-family HTH domain